MIVTHRNRRSGHSSNVALERDLREIALRLRLKVEIAEAGTFEPWGLRFASEARRRALEERAKELRVYVQILDPSFRNPPSFVARATRLADAWAVLLRAIDRAIERLTQGLSTPGQEVALLASAQAGVLAVCEELGTRDSEQQALFSALTQWARASRRYLPELERSRAKPSLLLEVSSRLDRALQTKQRFPSRGLNQARVRTPPRRRSERATPMPGPILPALAGKVILVVGGTPRPHAIRNLEAMLGVHVRWFETSSHRSQPRVREAMLAADVDIVVVLTRWADHYYGDLAPEVRAVGKHMIKVSRGYNKSSIARALVAQLGVEVTGTLEGSMQ